MANIYRAQEKPITLGSGDFYLCEYTGTLPSHSAICTDSNRFAYTQGGATITYSAETTEAVDDLGYLKKTILKSDSATVKANLLGWVGSTLKKMCSTARVTTSSGIRTTKIGGASNDDAKKYALCFHHHDAADGDIWVTVVGKNTDGIEIAFAQDKETPVGFTFTAEPFDNSGTLIRLEEQVGTPSTSCEITAFSINGTAGTISGTTSKTISVTLASGTDKTSLVPEFTASADSTVKIGTVEQESGVSVVDFTSSKTYVVTAQDGTSTTSYSVSVTVSS